MSRVTFAALLCVVLLLATSAVILGAESEFTITVDNGEIEIPERTVAIEGEEFTVTSIAPIDPGEQIDVSVSAPQDVSYNLHLYDGERRIVDSVSRTGDATATFETGFMDPGTYSLVIEEDGTFETIQPVVVTAYDTTVSAPEDVNQADTLTVEVSAEEHEDVDAPEIEEVQVVVADEEVADRIRATPTDGNEWKAEIDTERDPGEYRLYATLHDDERIDNGELNIIGMSDERTLEITEAEDADFQIANITPMSIEIAADDTFDLEATIENVGDWAATQTVTVQIDEEELDTTEVTLEGGENTTVEFTDIEGGEIGPGEHTFEIVTANDTREGSLTIDSEDDDDPTPPSDDDERPDDEQPTAEGIFEVTDINPVDVEITRSETFDLEVTVENTGNETGTQTVTVSANGELLAEQELTLEPAEAETIVFDAIDSGELDTGTTEYLVAGDTEETSGTLTIIDDHEESSVRIDSHDIDPELPTLGERFDVTAVVTNPGERAINQTVELWIDDERRAERSVELAPTDEETIVFADIDTTEMDADNYTYTIRTESDEMTGSFVLSDDSDDRTTDDDAGQDDGDEDETDTDDVITPTADQTDAETSDSIPLRGVHLLALLLVAVGIGYLPRRIV